MARSFAKRLLSCLLFDNTCSFFAMRSWKLLMAMFLFFKSASISDNLVCALRSCSRKDLPSPSPVASGPACADMPAVNACIDHCAFSMSFLNVASWVASASNFSCSLLATFSFASACFWSSAIATLFFFWFSKCASKSDSRFFNLDSQDATSLANLEESSSSCLSLFERCVSRAAVRSFISFCASLSRCSSVRTSSTNCCNEVSISSKSWFLLSSRCFTWMYS
mmetsp:Transcript_2142/g.6364  ORF Transcript_2142/g.6364 Transcript_2142/m.6364 type:complete len:223 (+) Transcript_2142:2594-3262(+)